MATSVPPLLVVGHVTRDLFAGEAHERLGGAAACAAQAAVQLGVSVGLVTAAPPTHPLLASLARLPGLEIACRDSPTITTFALDYRGPRRRLACLATAAALEPA